MYERLELYDDLKDTKNILTKECELNESKLNLNSLLITLSHTKMGLKESKKNNQEDLKPVK